MKASILLNQIKTAIELNGDFEIIKQGDDEGNHYDMISGLDMDSWNGNYRDPLFQSQLDDDSDVIEDSKIVGVIY